MPVYRVRVPTDWKRRDPPDLESIVDTKKALCEFSIQGTSIRIAIHNFPSQHIPPIAQVNRWKRQFSSLDHANSTIEPQSFGGFSGLLFEGTGLMENKSTTIMGWAMQLAPEHSSVLSLPIGKSPPLDNPLYLKQMRADYTIKIVGTAQDMLEYRSKLIAFAHTFELIFGIPVSS